MWVYKFLGSRRQPTNTTTINLHTTLLPRC
nr:MAG TPA: hypothetical protein [Caudoviricetes sp.]